MKNLLTNKNILIGIISLLTIILVFLSTIFLQEEPNFELENCKEEVKRLKNNLNDKNNEISSLNNKISSQEAKIKELENGVCEGISAISEKSCEYMDTYEFKDYIDYKDGFIQGQFYILLDKWQTKDAPVMLMLDEKEYKKDFIKDHSYEVTYKKTIYYDENNNMLNERIYLVKIEPTDLKGMDQRGTNCILK